jgi:hypothetical protein
MLSRTRDMTATAVGPALPYMHRQLNTCVFENYDFFTVLKESTTALVE